MGSLRRRRHSGPVRARTSRCNRSHPTLRRARPRRRRVRLLATLRAPPRSRTAIRRQCLAVRALVVLSAIGGALAGGHPTGLRRRRPRPPRAPRRRGDRVRVPVGAMDLGGGRRHRVRGIGPRHHAVPRGRGGIRGCGRRLGAECAEPRARCRARRGDDHDRDAPPRLGSVRAPNRARRGRNRSRRRVRVREHDAADAPTGCVGVDHRARGRVGRDRVVRCRSLACPE